MLFDQALKKIIAEEALWKDEAEYAGVLTVRMKKAVGGHPYGYRDRAQEQADVEKIKALAKKLNATLSEITLVHDDLVDKHYSGTWSAVFEASAPLPEIWDFYYELSKDLTQDSLYEYFGRCLVLTPAQKNDEKLIEAIALNCWLGEPHATQKLREGLAWQQPTKHVSSST